MKTILCAAVVALTVPAGTKLATSYEEGARLRIETETSFHLETTNFEMERDGEPVEARWGGDQYSESNRREVHVDTILAVEDGKPTRVRRAFGVVKSKNLFEMGDNSNEGEVESPLADLTLELALDDGEVVVDVVEGSEPDQEQALQGHALTLTLDALLPKEELDEGDSWDLSGDAIAHALGLDMEGAYFPPPSRDDAEEGGGEGRRGRRGGGFGRGGGQSLGRTLRGAEWEGEAKLVSLDEDHDGVKCAAIEIELEASGELPEPEFGGRGGRGGMLGAPTAALGTTVEVELEGRLLFSLETRRPVQFTIEGTVTLDRDTEREFGERSMHIRSTQEGEFRQVVTFTEAAEGGEDE